MRNALYSLVIVGATIGGVAGCQSQTPQEKITEAGVPLTQAETIAHISGKTEIWNKGAGYYSPDGTLIIKSQGHDVSGTWEVKEDGSVCVDILGSTEDCHAYVNDGGTITLVYKDERSKSHSHVAEIRSGNQLDSF